VPSASHQIAAARRPPRHFLIYHEHLPCDGPRRPQYLWRRDCSISTIVDSRRRGTCPPSSTASILPPIFAHYVFVPLWGSAYPRVSEGAAIGTPDWRISSRVSLWSGSVWQTVLKPGGDKDGMDCFFLKEHCCGPARGAVPAKAAEGISAHHLSSSAPKKHEIIKGYPPDVP
jgi:hypothetical protein